MLRSALVLLFCWPLLATAAGASEEESAPKMPDVRPPIGVVGGTVFSKGTVTFEYRFERQTQDGLMVGDQTVPSVALTNAYVIVPIGQTNDTHISRADMDAL